MEKAICSVFRVNEAEVRSATTLIGDLGSESIDFLDLGYDLEKIVGCRTRLGCAGHRWNNLQARMQTATRGQEVEVG